MNRRRMILLFLSAMTVSVIIMVIVYGVFIKDMDFSIDVRNPESAPSPLERAEDDAEPDVLAEPSAPVEAATVKTPEDAKKAAEAEKQADKTETEPAPAPGEPVETMEDEPAPEPVELVSPPVPKKAPSEPAQPQSTPARPGLTGSAESASTLHYVYMDGFSSREAAEMAIKQLQSRGVSASPYVRQHNGQIILQFGVYSDRSNADAMARQLRGQSVHVKVE